MQEPPVRAHRERQAWLVSDDTTTGTEGTAPPPGGPAKDGARGTGPALEAHYRFLLWLVPAVERFPRSQKFLLGRAKPVPSAGSLVFTIRVLRG